VPTSQPGWPHRQPTRAGQRSPGASADDLEHWSNSDHNSRIRAVSLHAFNQRVRSVL
jgi:hypothetical protein